MIEIGLQKTIRGPLAAASWSERLSVRRHADEVVVQGSPPPPPFASPPHSDPCWRRHRESLTLSETG
jgi:hypothetical protein